MDSNAYDGITFSLNNFHASLFHHCVVEAMGQSCLLLKVVHDFSL